MERSLSMTGVGGQGVQLAAKILAEAATRRGRRASLLCSYGGEMRGGRVAASVIFGDSALRSPIKVSTAWSVIAMHKQYIDEVEHAITPETHVVYNRELCGDAFDRFSCDHIPIDATTIAQSIGGEDLASMILLGVYAGATGVASLDETIAAMTATVPAYRQQRVATNSLAITTGFELATPVADGWAPKQKVIA